MDQVGSPQRTNPAFSRPRTKRLLFWSAMVLLSYLLLEGLLVVGLTLGKGQLVVPGFFQAQREAVLAQEMETAPGSGYSGDVVVHPYLGYVSLPGDHFSQYGFLGSESPLRRRAPNRVIVGIVGGSVAAGFCDQGSARLAQTLQRHPRYAEKEFVFVNLGKGGYKQPQQLMTVAYLLSLEAEFDLLINLDGFNEVALYEATNRAQGVFPAFPQSWHAYVRSVTDPKTRAILAAVWSTRTQRRHCARWFSNSLWRYSMLANTVWKIQDRRLLAQHLEHRDEARLATTAAADYVATGPPFPSDSESELYDFLVTLWKNSSIQLDRLCRAGGISYYHFLQPNQYVEGTKVLTAEEREKAYSPNHPYRPGVRKGYPLLIREGRELVHEGVRFRDLTAIFKPISETLYIDECCHFNRRGHERLAVAIGQTILEDADK